MSTIDKISQLAIRISKSNMPEGSRVLLYGSRARGDWNKNSDWDLLLLINKPKIEEPDYANCFDPFTELSWELGEPISPQIYTISEWDKMKDSPFYENVERDKIIVA